MSLQIRHRLFLSVFCVGMAELFAQVLALRELLVVFFGNELTVGMILGIWLVCAGAGSLSMRFFLPRCGFRQVERWVVGLLMGMVFLFPAQIWFIRGIRLFFHVPFGEYVPLGTLLAGTAAALCAKDGVCRTACHKVTSTVTCAT